MAIFIRKVGEVADGAVTEVKLADSAVDLAGSKITGELGSGNIADSAIIESKLGALAVTTAKLGANAVTLQRPQRLSKCLQRSHYLFSFLHSHAI